MIANLTARPGPASGSVLLLSILAACGQDPVAPPPDPIHITAITDQHLSGIAGTEVPRPAVQLNNSKGPVENGKVIFDFGTHRDVLYTNSSGTVGDQWILGRVVGVVERLVARGPGGDSVVFEATTLPVPPPRIAFINAPEPTVVGTVTTIRPAVRVIDGYGAPMVGAAVQFKVLKGGGTLQGDHPVTDQDGVATLGSYQLGPSLRIQWLLALGPGGSRDSLDTAAIPKTLEALTPPNQRVHILALAPIQPAVRALDALDQPMKDVFVEFASFGPSALRANAFASPNQETDSLGIARWEDWAAGSEPGTYTMSAQTYGIPAFLFTLTAVVPGPARAVVLKGDTQTGLAGNFLGPHPEIQYFDSAGAPIFNLTVNWATDAGATILKHSTRTDQNGIAYTEGWRLGPNAGVTTLVASTQSMAPTTLTATASSVPAQPFDITVRLVDVGTVLNSSDSLEVTAAVTRWTNVLRGGLPDVPVSVPDSVCGTALDETVNDLLIFVRFVDIDGPGKVLGGSTPCILRAGSHLPVVGEIILDRADMVGSTRTAAIRDVLAHEIGHVLGIGSLWRAFNLLDAPPTSVAGYIGDFGRTALHGLAPLETYWWASVPIDNSFVPGTHQAHWSEEQFTNELMTPFDNPHDILSVITVASLRDLGYLTTDLQAEPFSLMAAVRRLNRTGPARRLQELDLKRPMIELDGRGRTVRVIRPR